MQSAFHLMYSPAIDCTPAPEDVIAQYQSVAPASLIEIWRTTGLGKYRNGLIEFVNPNEFKPNLITWLGKDQPHYIPFAITGFGELLYFRKLTETEEDVCMVDIQYRQTSVLCLNFDRFIQEYLTNEDNRNDIFREEFFLELIAANGPLAKHEIFTFMPILAFGGNTGEPTVQKGNAQTYIDLVFTLTS